MTGSQEFEVKSWDRNSFSNDKKSPTWCKLLCNAEAAQKWCLPSTNSVSERGGGVGFYENLMSCIF